MAAKQNPDKNLTPLRYKLNDAAYMIQVSPDKLRELFHAGEISAHRSTGTDKGHLFFTLEALQEFVADQQIRRAA
jgi:acyl-CoA hydrolase